MDTELTGSCRHVGPWHSSWGAVLAPSWPCWSLSWEGCWLQLPQGTRGVLGPAVPSSAGWVKLVAEASVGSRGQAVVWPWGWPRQGLKGKGPSILAQSRGLGTTCLWPHRSLGGLGGNCITVATGDPEGCPGGRGAGRPDLEPPGPQSQACSYGPLRGLLLGIWDGLAR